MKTSRSLNLLLALVLSVSPLASAQEAADCDLLESRIAKLQKIDFSNLSPSLQKFYMEQLLNVYVQFRECIQRDVSATTAMREAAAGTNAAPAFDGKLRELISKRDATDGKITGLRLELNLPDDAANSGDGTAGRPATDSTVRAFQPPGAKRDQTGSALMNALNPVPAPAPNPVNPPAPAQPTVNPCVANVSYDAPELLRNVVANAAADVVRTQQSDRVTQRSDELVLYTIFDAASPASSAAVRKLAAYQYLGETARTDKQLGASAKAAGTVSAIERPGFARLLGFAVEHGGIIKKNDGTNLTLSTSLYSLYAMNGGDTAETYDRAGVLNRIAASATFAISNKDDDLLNARRNNLSEWSVKARLFGDRSTRSPQFRKFWDEEIRPLIGSRLVAIGTAVEGLSEDNSPDRLSGFNDIEDPIATNLPGRVAARMACADYTAATTDTAKQKIISDFVLGELKTNVLDPIKGGRFTFTPEEVRRIELDYLPRLKTAHDSLELGRTLLQKRIADLKTGPLGTFAYTNHRQPLASDYSETKFLFEQDKSFFRPLKLTGNFGLSFYHKPDRALNQQKLRDVSAALAFEGTTESPFTEADNLSKITYSFVGRYERLMENRRMANRKPDIATAQFLLEIPFVKGFSLPFSLTYANATEEERKKNVRFNFGMRLDTDKLFEMLRAPANR